MKTGLSPFRALLPSVLILAACSGSSPSSDGGATFNDTDELRAYLVTGRDDTDTASWWRCDIADGAGGSVGLDIRLWQDGRGHAGNRSADWSLDADTLRLDFGATRTTLEQLRATRDGDGREGFETVSGSGESVDCLWRGRGRDAEASSLALDDEGSGVLGRLTGVANGATEQPWYCTVAHRNGGSVVSHELKLAVNGFGVLDGEPIEWFIDERAHLVMSTDAALTVFDGVHFPDPDVDAHFIGTHRGGAVDCRR